MKDNYETVRELLEDAREESEELREEIRKSGPGGGSSVFAIHREDCELDLAIVARKLQGNMGKFADDEEELQELVDEIREAAEFPSRFG